MKGMDWNETDKKGAAFHCLIAISFSSVGFYVDGGGDCWR